MDTITRAYEAVVDDVANDQRTVTAIVNTGSVDRYRSVIDPAGINLDAYRKNPTILWEHGKDPTRGRLPIGRAQWIKRQGERLVSRVQFGKDDYSQTLFEMYRDGMCRGWSIFALPDSKQTGPPTRAEIKARPDLADCEVVYRSCELGEVSCVAVPGNSETLTLMEARGIWFPDEARTVATEPEPEPEPDEAAEHDAPAPEPAEEAPEPEPARAAPAVPEATGRLYTDIHAQLVGDLAVLRADIMSHIRDTLDLVRGRV